MAASKKTATPEEIIRLMGEMFGNSEACRILQIKAPKGETALSTFSKMKTPPDMQKGDSNNHRISFIETAVRVGRESRLLISDCRDQGDEAKAEQAEEFCLRLMRTLGAAYGFYVVPKSTAAKFKTFFDDFFKILQSWVIFFVWV